MISGLWSWFPTIWEWFSMWINRIDHGCRCATEFIRMSLHSTEITRYHSRFLEYKLIGCTPFRTGAHDGFSKNPHRWCPGITTYTSCHWHLSIERNHHSKLLWPPVKQLKDTIKTSSDIYRRGIAEKEYLWKMPLESHRQCTWSMWGTQQEATDWYADW